MRYEAEEIAKKIIEFIIPGAIMHHQDNQSAGEHDFDLEYPDGVKALMEVTVSTNQALEAKVDQIRSAKKGGAFIKTSLCHQDWWIHPLPNADIKKIRSQVDKYLAAIEADGLDKFFSPIDSASYLSIEKIYVDLSIEGGNVTHWKKPGQIGISLPGDGGVVDAENFQKAIEVEASKSDNRRKLGSRDASERHLFVYVSSLNYLVWKVLVDGDMPIEPPHLPVEITDVWAVTTIRQKNQYMVWKASKGTGWQNLGVVLLN